MIEPGQPCPYCSVRPDVACRHRPADTSWSMGEAPVDDDGRKGPHPGRGHNFKSRKKMIDAKLKAR